MLKIVVNVRDTIPEQHKVNIPPNAKPGFQTFFTEDVVLTQYDTLTPTPGGGLAEKEADRFVGIHSGILTVLRVTDTGDRFYTPVTRIVQYLATYRFRSLPSTPLSQITGRGEFLFNITTHKLVEPPITYAITGGTGAYANARGKIVELGNATDDRELHIEL
jgi:hypothetical protein